MLCVGGGGGAKKEKGKGKPTQSNPIEKPLLSTTFVLTNKILLSAGSLPTTKFNIF